VFTGKKLNVKFYKTGTIKFDTLNVNISEIMKWLFIHINKWLYDVVSIINYNSARIWLVNTMAKNMICIWKLLDLHRGQCYLFSGLLQPHQAHARTIF
jgi:hypothetical protein